MAIYQVSSYNNNSVLNKIPLKNGYSKCWSVLKVKIVAFPFSIESNFLLILLNNNHRFLLS